MWLDIGFTLAGFVAGCALTAIVGGGIKAHVTAELNKLRADLVGRLK